MLTKVQEQIINKYVNEEYYDKEKLIKYLNVHDIVGNEVFDYVDRKNRKLNRKEAHSQWLDDEDGYIPVHVDIFVRRIPLYFYTWDGNFNTHSQDIGDIMCSKWKEIKEGEISIEDIYKDLEYMFYQKKISLYNIFNYMTEQTGLVTEAYFFEWVEYLHICDELDWNDIMPDNFIFSYNKAREAKGLSPMIFTPIWDAHMEVPYYRNGSKLTFEGVFPCDEYGNPIMKWIGLKLVNEIKDARCTCEKAKNGYLEIEVKPNSVIYFKDENESGEFWNQIYAGPLTMQFDSAVLKQRRNRLGYTQQEVADAIGANLRTYQKWESGETEPAGYYLLRLMNWLDISSTQEIIKFNFR